MENKILVSNLSALKKVADQLITLMPQCQTFTFDGPLGVGKTTLIKQILQKCGIEEPVTSPTFNYVNVYENAKGQLFYHFDLYRIQSLDQFLHAGFDEYLYLPNSWAFIEWPKVVEPLLTKKVCTVLLEYGKNEHDRIIRINY